MHLVITFLLLIFALGSLVTTIIGILVKNKKLFYGSLFSFNLLTFFTTLSILIATKHFFSIH